MDGRVERGTTRRRSPLGGRLALAATAALALSLPSCNGAEPQGGAAPGPSASALAAGSAALAGGECPAPSDAPAASPKRAPSQLTVVDAGGKAVRDAFQAARGKRRLLAIFSPGCGNCSAAARALREEVEERRRDADIDVIIVWSPMLISDSVETARVAKDTFSDPRIHQFYEEDRATGAEIAKAIGQEANGPAWDILLAYDGDASAENGFPPPRDFVVQLHDEAKNVFVAINGDLTRSHLERAELPSIYRKIIEQGLLSGCVARSGKARDDLAAQTSAAPCKRGRLTDWATANGARRAGCLVAPKSNDAGPLPVVVYFHDEGETAGAVDRETALLDASGRFTWPTGNKTGFVVLAPEGRSGPAGKSVFDAAYVAPDNADIVAVEDALHELSAQGVVDASRVYAMGAGAGGRMAATYATVRADHVAAFATYGAPSIQDLQWSCSSPPPPAFIAYRAYDEAAPCASVESWLLGRDLAFAQTERHRVRDDGSEAPGCLDAPERKEPPMAARWPASSIDGALRLFGHYVQRH